MRKDQQRSAPLFEIETMSKEGTKISEEPKFRISTMSAGANQQR
jgi:hypothetical protein